MRQLQVEEANLSYLRSQWEMCSTSTDVVSVEMALSTGITCMPKPAPPGGTIGATMAGPTTATRSKYVAISGCSCSICWFMA